jgi:PqqD family protein of HPr-rel-A system
MADADMTPSACYRIPPGVEFQRWQGAEEWVLYHSGTGETMRLSDAALAILDLLSQTGPMDQAALAEALNAMMDAPLSPDEIGGALGELLRMLLSHECVEQTACS